MSEALAIDSRVKLNDGRSMPLLGIGVALIEEGEPTENAVKWALETGYRHVDTAAMYGNEASVGKAIRESEVAPKEVWVTTKLWPTDFHHPRKALEASLQRLGSDYVDLYLIHWPMRGIPGFNQQLWRTFEKFHEEGLCKTIGVSNFSIPRLQKILVTANTPPAVNQVRCSPFTYPKGLHEFCMENDIALEGYSPLTQGVQLDDDILRQLAEKHQKTTAQIMLRWAVQKRIIVIPKSRNQSRIAENADLYDFELIDDDMDKLEALSR